MTTPVALRFLGSGDTFGSGGRFQTCMHLSGAGGVVLIDYKTIEAQAERLGARRIILTHMGRDMLAREAEARFERAHDGLVVML